VSATYREELSSSAQGNIETVVRLEQEELERRTLSERIGESIAIFSGSMTFFLVHVSGFIFWAIVNTGLIPSITPFDPYPFNFMTMVVSFEAVLLSTFVLMRQNRMAKRADRRDRLNLQIDLLAEKEITKLLQLVQQICDRLEIPQGRTDPEVNELSHVTAVDRLASELDKKLPE
jgi:uncharacterized membrane protein